MKKTHSLNRLKGKKLIDLVFDQGKTFRSKHLLLRVLGFSDSKSLVRCGVSVGKRNFKKAVVRNKIKRQLRVVLQKNSNKIPFSGAYMLIYNTGFFTNTNDLVLELGLLLDKLKTNNL